MTCPFISDKAALKNVLVYFYPEGATLNLSRPEDRVLHVKKVKEAVAEYRGLKDESLDIFGVFSGSLENPNRLLMDKIPEDVIEVSMLRLSLDPDKEKRVIDKDPSARHMIFCELKFLYERNFLLPVARLGNEEKINDLLCNASDDMEKELILIISRHFFTYTSRNHLVTCQRNLCAPPLLLSVRIVPIRVALSSEAIVFFDVSGEKILMYWPWKTIICIRYCNSCVKILALYILVDEITHKVLRPIIIQTSCNEYLRRLSIYADNFNSQMQAGSSLPDNPAYPYYFRKFNNLDLETGINGVENYLDIIASEVGMYISKEKLKDSNLSLIDNCNIRKPTAVYVRQMGGVIDNVNNIGVRTITMVHVMESRSFKIQLMNSFGQVTTAHEVIQGLVKYYGLARCLNPDEIFQVYFYEQSGKVRVLSGEGVVPEDMKTLYFEASTTCRPNLTCTLRATSNTGKGKQRINLVKEIFERRQKHHGFRLQTSRIEESSTEDKSHPLSQAHHAPPEGSQAPNNTPESCYSTPTDNSPTKGAQNGFVSSLRSPRNLLNLLQDVAERLSKLANLQTQEYIPDFTPPSSESSQGE